jgi:hypothetical protein
MKLIRHCHHLDPQEGVTHGRNREDTDYLPTRPRDTVMALMAIGLPNNLVPLRGVEDCRLAVFAQELPQLDEVTFLQKVDSQIIQNGR